jgi:hypothetical protein
VKSGDVSGMCQHDLRIANPNPKVGDYPNYVKLDKMENNSFLKQISASDIFEEFDARLEIRNEDIDDHNLGVKAQKKMWKTMGKSVDYIKKNAGKYKRKLKKCNFDNRAFSGLIGLSDEAIADLKIDTKESRDAVDEIFKNAFDKVLKKLDLSDDDVTHAVVHWDESKPHFHFGLHYLDSKGESINDKLGPGAFSKIIKEVNMEMDGFEPPVPYIEQRAKGIKPESHKSTKVLKRDSERMALKKERLAKEFTDELLLLKAENKRLTEDNKILISENKTGTTILDSTQEKLEDTQIALGKLVMGVKHNKTIIAEQAKEFETTKNAINSLKNEKKVDGENLFFKLWGSFAMKKKFNSKENLGNMLSQTDALIPKSYSIAERTAVKRFAEELKEKLLNK